jgi:hypothetical protein
MIKKLQAACPGFLENTDLIAGTSTGGMLAIGLALGLSPDDLLKLYTEHGGEIFDDAWSRGIASLDGLREAKYDNVKLHALLLKTFGTACLKDLKKKVVIPTLNLNAAVPGGRNRISPRCMHNFSGPDSDQELSAVVAALRTSAAPTYFPVFQTFADGGLVANDPSLCAVARALKSAQVLKSEVVVLSLGTGVQYKCIPGEDHDAGLLFWAPKLIDILLDGNVELSDELCGLFLEDGQYRREDPELPDGDPVPLDAWKRADELIRVGANHNLDDAIKFVGKFWPAPTSA